MLEKNHFTDHQLTRTRETRHDEDINLVAFYCINFELISIK